MNKFISLVVFIFFSYSLTAQEIAGKSSPRISEEVHWELSKATGMLLDIDGTWISRDKKIPVCLPELFKSDIDKGKYSLGIDNFEYLQLRSIIVGDSTYYVFIKKYYDGFYKFASIEEDWTDSYSFYYSVFRKSELEKLRNIEFGKINLIKLSAMYHGIIKKVQDGAELLIIQNKLEKYLEKPNYYTESVEKLVFNINSMPQEKEVRFFITHQTKTPYHTYKYSGICKDNSIIKVNVDYTSPELFNKFYYTTDFGLFQLLLEVIE